jgi:hypothetical protein
METSKAVLNATGGRVARSKQRGVRGDTRKAADYIDSKPKTLEHWRCAGGGPGYAKSSRRTVRAQAAQTQPRPDWCDTERAARHINSTAKTLEHWRRVGGGPRYAKAGRRCVYRLDWLDAWLESRSVTSTAEARRVGIL